MSCSNLATTASGGAGIAAAMNNQVSKLLKMNCDYKLFAFRGCRMRGSGIDEFEKKNVEGSATNAKLRA